MTAHHFHNPKPALWQDLTPDAKDSAVRALAATGLSSSAIAAMLGTTKNAVISVANRRSIQIGADIPTTTYSARNAARALQPGRAVAEETWAPLGVPVAAPTRRQCSWPVGAATGSAQMFCGGVRVRGSYCATHAAMAFRPAQPAELTWSDMLKDGKVLSGVEPGITAEEALAVVLPKGKMETEE